MKLREISLGRIRLRDRRFTFTRGGGVEGLVASISRIGLLSPPDLMESGGRLVVIRGSRRLRALRQLGRRRVEARIFGDSELPPLEAWQLNFFDNLAIRTFNTAEICTALAQLSNLAVPPRRIVEEYLPLTGLPRRPEALDECRRIAALEEAVLDALAEGSLTAGTALFLSALDDRDRKAAFRFLRLRRLTVSQQREWIRLVPDVAALEGKTVSMLLSSVSRGVSKGAGHPGNIAIEILRERRYPTLAARRKQFRRLVGKFRLPPAIRIDSHPFLERRELNVRFTAGDRPRFEEALRLLEKVVQDRDFERLLDPGSSEIDR